MKCRISLPTQNANPIKAYLLIIFILFEFQLLCFSLHYSTEASSAENLENSLPPLKLVGVLISEEPSSSVAVFKNENTGKITIVKTGEIILGVELTRVYKNRVVLEKGKKTFQLYMGSRKFSELSERSDINLEEQLPFSRGAKANNSIDGSLSKPKEFQRLEVEKRVMAEMPMLMREARIIPNLVNGKMEGLRITRLPKKSILSELGIHRNDVIKEINDILINDLETLLSLYDKLWKEDRFKVVLERNGKIVRMQYILK